MARPVVSSGEGWGRGLASKLYRYTKATRAPGRELLNTCTQFLFPPGLEGSGPSSSLALTSALTWRLAYPLSTSVSARNASSGLSGYLI